MKSRFAAAMFDLDGTLADTLEDIAAAGNHALTQLHRPALPVPRYRYLAGQGARWLVAEALGPEAAALVPQALEIFKAYQLEHSLDHTRPYPGIAQLLDALANRRMKLAVLSNKPHRATDLVVARVLSRWKFDVVRGQRDDAPLKPDPAQALAIARELHVLPAQWLYLGDTRVDMQTAKAAGFFAVGVLWGFREEAELREGGADAIIKSPSEVLRLLQ